MVLVFPSLVMVQVAAMLARTWDTFCGVDSMFSSLVKVPLVHVHLPADLADVYPFKHRRIFGL